jgi:tetratricopeptide (TPR) repeat protein
MNSSWMRKLVGLIIALSALFAALPVFAQTGGLTGSCKGDDGKPLAGYTIVIERQEIKWSSKVKTNKKGEYTYIGLAPGNYKLTLTDPQGRQVFNISHHVGIGDPTPVDFDMAKEKVLAQKEQQANPEYQKKLEEQAKEQKQFTGLKQIFDQGQQLYDQKKYEEAAATFEKALPLAKEKNVPIVLSRLGETYSRAAGAATDRDTQTKDREKALDYYQKAIAANPSDASLHNNLGSLYADMGKISEAQAEFQKSAELNPAGAGRVYYNLGVVMYNKGKMDEAATALKKATELDPNFPDAYYLEAQTLLSKATTGADGKVIPAPGTVEALQTYLKLDPNGKWSQAAKDSLNLLTGKVETEYKKKKKG